MPDSDFAKGSTAPPLPYDTSPTGLGLSPSYLAPSTSASASANIASSILTGRINSVGTIAAGTGFTVAKGAAGLYTVTFTSTFAAVPTVQITPGPLGVDVTAVLNAVSVSAFTAFLLVAGAATDEPFHFLVVATQ